MSRSAAWSRCAAVVMAGWLVVPMLIGGCPGGNYPSQSIMATVREDESLSILAEALQSAGLDDKLRNSTTCYTIFAPTDDAFNSLPAAVREELLKVGNEAWLAQVLRGHIIPGRCLVSQLGHNDVLTDLNGVALVVTISNGCVHVGGAAICEADIQAGNGTIQKTGAVILPP